MNIRDWPMDRIMQLPDWCFGRRWPVFLRSYAPNATPTYDISEVALPERCVFWWFGWDISAAELTRTLYRLALGDQLPTTEAQMSTLEPLFMGLGVQGAEPREIQTLKLEAEGGIPLRTPINTTGRRPVLETKGFGTNYIGARITLVVSSMPTEVPDWLVSP